MHVRFFFSFSLSGCRPRPPDASGSVAAALCPSSFPGCHLAVRAPRLAPCGGHPWVGPPGTSGFSRGDADMGREGANPCPGDGQGICTHPAHASNPALVFLQPLLVIWTPRRLLMSTVNGKNWCEPRPRPVRTGAESPWDGREVTVSPLGQLPTRVIPAVPATPVPIPPCMWGLWQGGQAGVWGQRVFKWLVMPWDILKDGR